MNVSLAAIQAARTELSKYIKPTPLLFNSWLSEQLGCELYLKLENMQPIGSFKIRGATYKISQLSAAERRRGVIAASAGNHAQGVAWGSRRLGTSALIVMPKGAPLVKEQNTRSLGAEIMMEGQNFQEAFDFAQSIAKKSGRVFIHAFEDEHIMAGAGTVGLEILEQLPDPDFVVSAIGGGGLMTGVSTVFRALRPQTRLIGCQASGAPAMIRALHTGKSVTLHKVDTFADGIAVGRATETMRRLLAPRLDEILEADDEAIAAAILMLLEKAKTLAEGSGALPLAVLEQMRRKIRGKKVVIIVSGGNIDVNLLSRIIDRGLIRAGRLVRVNIWMSDRPGSLARLTALISSQGANIIQAIHDRSQPSTRIDQTEVALTLETRGPKHSEALIEALRQDVIRVEFTD
ncbi:threonine ammonia-lyase [Bdellovibrionota bacterium FG-1]